MKTERSVVWTLLLSLAVLPAHAAEKHLTFAPEQTTISWTLEATGHDVSGHFALISGALDWNPDTGDVDGRIEIDATSARSGNDRRDRKMHTDVLESETYPRFVLTASKLQGTVSESGAIRVNLHGTLSIHGQEHAVVLPATLTIKADHVDISTSFRIPFVEWGMKDPSFLVLRVAKEVQVNVKATAALAE